MENRWNVFEDFYDPVCVSDMDSGQIVYMNACLRDMLDVDLFIVVEYGISIAEVCKTIVDQVRYKLESMTGVKVRKVNISVEGIRV